MSTFYYFISSTHFGPPISMIIFLFQQLSPHSKLSLSLSLSLSLLSLSLLCLSEGLWGDWVIRAGMDEQELQPLSSSESGSGGAKRDVDQGGGGGGGWGSSNTLGKHRMAAAITLLNQQINIIQQELEQLETIGHSSIVCNELISEVESIPDPLLPMTKGPADMNWDRWFQGAQRSRKGRLCRPWISN